VVPPIKAVALPLARKSLSVSSISRVPALCEVLDVLISNSGAKALPTAGLVKPVVTFKLQFEPTGPMYVIAPGFGFESKRPWSVTTTVVVPSDNNNCGVAPV